MTYELQEWNVNLLIILMHKVGLDRGYGDRISHSGGDFYSPWKALKTEFIQIFFGLRINSTKLTLIQLIFSSMNTRIKDFLQVTDKCPTKNC